MIELNGKIGLKFVSLANEIENYLGLKTDVVSKTAPVKTSAQPKPKRKVNFKENKFSSILNETESLRENTPLDMNSYAELMTEDITMTSADAMNFGAARKMPIQRNMAAPSVMTDPETGKNMQVDPVLASVLTRDYSALMKAIDNKKGK